MTRTLPAPARPDDADRWYLGRRLAAVERRVRALVTERRRIDQVPDDPFRGLYLSEDALQRLLDREGPEHPGDAGLPRDDDAERVADGRARDGRPLRLRVLEEAFGLQRLDVDLLLVALAPDLDPRFEWAYGYLHDDVTRRRASPGLALEVCGAAFTDGSARARLAVDAPLVREGLLRVDERERPFLSRTLLVPDRVVAHLLGDDEPDPLLREVLSAPAAPVGVPAPVAALAVAGALRRGVRLCHVRQPPGGVGVALAVGALAAAGRTAVVVDLGRVPGDGDLPAVVAGVRREAGLRRAGVVVHPLEAAAAHGLAVMRALCRPGPPVLFVGGRAWDPVWADDPPLVLTAEPMPTEERSAELRRHLGPVDGRPDPGSAADAIRSCVVAPAILPRIARTARQQADLEARPVSAADVRWALRAQNDTGLERLARRVEPSVSWDDLVLPATTLTELRELAARALHRERVLGDWRMRPGGGRGRGVTALFTGDSGTGKTMSAEVVAQELGLDLYAVDLSTVVDKYVGETEKNLERIFTEAAGVHGLLLFDEADAIFGKRSEVRDAHDRYANIESAYLLQRMEAFDGLAVLSTNLRANLDEAFTRRLDMVIDFPTPDEQHRLGLWRRCLAPPLPVGTDVDVGFCARSFELAGGNIRSAATTAAYLAAAEDAPVAMRHVVLGVAREYRKLGRLCLPREFGPYQAVLSAAS